MRRRCSAWPCPGARRPSEFTAVSQTMPPRLGAPVASIRIIPFRPRPSTARWTNSNTSAPVQQLPRFYATSKSLPVSEDNSNNNKGPNTDPLPHVSEEAAALSKITGDEGPDLTQGTPVQEVRRRAASAHPESVAACTDKLLSRSSKVTRQHRNYCQR